MVKLDNVDRLCRCGIFCYKLQPLVENARQESDRESFGSSGNKVGSQKAEITVTRNLVLLDIHVSNYPFEYEKNQTVHAWHSASNKLKGKNERELRVMNKKNTHELFRTCSILVPA